MPTSKITVRRYPSPCGRLLIGAYNEHICLCDFEQYPGENAILQKVARRLKTSSTYGNTPVLSEACSRLDEYFAGRLREFHLPLLPCGTPFQQKVFDALSEIPYGATSSYREIAAAIGTPLATRAVANAIGANPIAIFLPCHRIIRSDGSIGGFRGGLEAKRLLLNLEKNQSL